MYTYNLHETNIADLLRLKIKMHFANKAEPCFKEGEIWWASFNKLNPTTKTHERLVLILKVFNNKFLWAIPITPQTKKTKYSYTFRNAGKKYSIKLSQIRLISDKKLISKVKMMRKQDFNRIKDNIKSFI